MSLKWIWMRLRAIPNPKPLARDDIMLRPPLSNWWARYSRSCYLATIVPTIPLGGDIVIFSSRDLCFVPMSLCLGDPQKAFALVMLLGSELCCMYSCIRFAWLDLSVILDWNLANRKQKQIHVLNYLMENWTTVRKYQESGDACASVSFSPFGLLVGTCRPRKRLQQSDA